MSPAPQPLTFYNYPPEIRIDIYDLALPAPFFDYPGWQNATYDRPRKRLPALLAVSRLVRSEAAAVYFGRRDFCINSPRLYFNQDHPSSPRLWLERIGAEHSALLRSLTMPLVLSESLEPGPASGFPGDAEWTAIWAAIGAACPAVETLSWVECDTQDGKYWNEDYHLSDSGNQLSTPLRTTLRTSHAWEGLREGLPRLRLLKISLSWLTFVAIEEPTLHAFADGVSRRLRVVVEILSNGSGPTADSYTTDVGVQDGM